MALSSLQLTPIDPVIDELKGRRAANPADAVADRSAKRAHPGDRQSDGPAHRIEGLVTTAGEDEPSAIDIRV